MSKIHKYQDCKMSMKTIIVTLTVVTICLSDIVGAFNLPFLSSASSEKSDESFIIKDPVTDLGRLSGKKLQQGVSNKLTNHNLVGTASDVHYVPRQQHHQEQLLAEQLALLPAANAIYESQPVMPPGKRRLDADSDALASNNRGFYPMLNDAAVRRKMKLMLKYDQSGLGNVIDSGSDNIQGGNSAIEPKARRDIDGNRRLVNLEGRLSMATTQNRKPLRVRKLSNSNNLRKIASNNVYQESRANQGRASVRARSATNRRQSGKLQQSRSSDDNDDGDEDDSKSENDESADLDNIGDSSADRRSGGDDSFEREASKDFNSDAQDNTDQRSDSNGGEGRGGGNRLNGARYLKHSASNRGQGRQYVPVHNDQSNADDSGGQDDEDIDSTNIVSGSLHAPLRKKVVHLQVEQSSKKNYPQVSSKMNQVNDIQAAAGHHHNHHHGHYYQYIEVPKKKTWKFGFKRGNHKHEISKHEKGHKSKFHTEFKWHAKEKCKKHKKCKSVGKMTWDYKHHKKHH